MEWPFTSIVASRAGTCKGFRETPPQSATNGRGEGQRATTIRGPPRRAAILLSLTSLWPQGRGGSSPLFRTIRLGRYAPSLMAGHDTSRPRRMVS
jgi:hypothetical protein